MQRLPVIVLLVLGALRGPWIVQCQDSKLCNGVFDLYFVLDSSTSVGGNYRSSIVPFVQGVINHYAQSGFRIAIVTFDTRRTVQLGLTPISNTGVVRDTLNRLNYVQLRPATILHPALQYVNEEIAKTSGGAVNRTNIILIVTDGGLSDTSRATQQARTARTKGSTIFAIGVGRVISHQLYQLTGYNDRVFIGSNFNYLHQILDKVVKEICIEITPPNTTIHNTVPLKYCRGQNPSINISGSGFNTLNRPTCHFWTPKGLKNNLDQQPVVTDTTLLCPTPQTGHYIGDLYLQVTTRNNYKENSTTLIIEDCRRLFDAYPSQWCESEFVQKVHVSGIALNDGLNKSVHCKYTLPNEMEDITYPSVNNITYDQVICPTSKNLTLYGNVTIDISLNGADYVPNSVFVQIEDACTRVRRTPPLKYCRSQVPSNITIPGSGFAKLYQPYCHFRTSEGAKYYTQPVTTDSRLICPSPQTGNHTGDLLLQVATNVNMYKKNLTTIIIRDCRKLIEAFPSQWCMSELVEEVNVSGIALTDGLIETEAHCSYRIQNGAEYITYPFKKVTSNRITCPLQSSLENFTLHGNVVVKVSLNGVEYVPNSVTIKITDCTSYAFIAGIAGGLLALLILLLCCLLWCLFPLITGTVVGGVVAQKEDPVLVPSPPPTPSAPPPPPPVATPRLPGRKWTIVDTSYYGIRGAGGIRPVKVTWGDKGTTEEGAKLRRAKDAIKLGEVNVPGPIAPPTAAASTLTTIGEEEEDDDPLINSSKKWGCCKFCCLLCYQCCCGILIHKIRRCYRVIASYRPVFTYHGTLGKRVLCCPGPDIEEKLKTNEQLESSNQRPPSRGGAPQPPQWKIPSTKTQLQEPLLSSNLSTL